MSPQVAFLKNLITSAQTGNEEAIAKLRRIAVRAPEQAPVPGLISISELLVHLGIQATPDATSQN